MIFTDSPLGLKIQNLGILPTREPLYCSALTGKCTRCVKQCLCLSLAVPLSNPTFQSKHERRLFIGSSLKKENLNTCQIYTPQLGSAAVLLLLRLPLVLFSVCLRRSLFPSHSLARSVIYSINVFSSQCSGTCRLQSFRCFSCRLSRFLGFLSS